MSCYNAMGQATVTIGSSGESFAGYADEYLIQKTSQDVTGPLIECSNLLLEQEVDCPGAKGHVCFFNGEETQGGAINAKPLWDLYQSAKNNGCIAMVVANAWFPVDNEALHILFIVLLEKTITSTMMGEDVRVQTQVAGTGYEIAPFYTEGTNNGLHCGKNEYCQYWGIKMEGQYTEGVCTACPTLENGEPNPSVCFFSQDDYINWHFNPDIVKSCATSCHASLGKSIVVF